MEKKIDKAKRISPLGKRLKGLKITQIDAANAIGIKYQKLNRMLNGYDLMGRNIEKELISICERVEGGS